MTPLVSILTTTYNVERFVKRAIQSAINQTFPNIQIIVVDDCSSDNTWSMLQGFKDQVLLTRHRKRRRVSAALNTALKQAKGKYITRLDGDDQLFPKLIETEVEFLEKHPNVGFVYCDYCEVDADGKLIRQVKLPEYRPEIIHLVDYIALGNMIRSDCYRTIGNYDEKMKRQEHYDFSIRLARKYQGVHLAESLFAYTRRPGQATSNLKALRYYSDLVRKKYGLKQSEVVKWQ